METQWFHPKSQIYLWIAGSTAVLIVLCSTLAHASGPGTTGGTILSMPMGARAIAMGEAYTAQADDVSSLYWNPAGLALLNQSQASFMYSQEFQDISLSQAAVATPLENGGLGASVSYLNYGKITGLIAPIFWSMLALFALVIVHLSVELPPALIVVGLAEKVMLGGGVY